MKQDQKRWETHLDQTDDGQKRYIFGSQWPTRLKCLAEGGGQVFLCWSEELFSSLKQREFPVYTAWCFQGSQEKLMDNRKKKSGQQLRRLELDWPGYQPCQPSYNHFPGQIRWNTPGFTEKRGEWWIHIRVYRNNQACLIQPALKIYNIINNNKIIIQQKDENHSWLKKCTKHSVNFIF